MFKSKRILSILLIFVMLISSMGAYANESIPTDLKGFNESVFEDGTIYYSKFIKDNQKERVLISYYDEEFRITTYNLITNVITQELIDFSISESEVENKMETFSSNELTNNSYNVIDKIEIDLNESKQEREIEKLEGLQNQPFSGLNSNVFGKYGLREITKYGNDYTVSLSVPGSSFTTRNMAGQGTAQYNTRKMVDLFDENIDNIRGSVNDIIFFGLGLIPGIGEGLTVIDMIESFNGGMTTEKFLKGVLPGLLEVAFGRAAAFFKVAEIATYGSLALGYKHNLESYYSAARNWSSQIN